MRRSSTPALLVARAWITDHRGGASAAGLVAVAAACALLGRVEVANPLGAEFVTVRATILMPTVAASLVALSSGEQLEARQALCVRRTWHYRLIWTSCCALGAWASLLPLAPLVPVSQLALDVAMLFGVALVLTSAVGLGAALAWPLLAFLAYLVRKPGDAPALWAVLEPHGSTHPVAVATLALGCGVTTYAARGARQRRL